MKTELIKRGLDPSMEQGLVLSVVMSAITHGDHQALKTIQNILEQTTSAADKREQRARIKRAEAEARRIEEETARKNGTAGHDIAQAQSMAISQMINNPQSERVLQDFLGVKDEDGSNVTTDPIQPAEQEAE